MKLKHIIVALLAVVGAVGELRAENTGVILYRDHIQQRYESALKGAATLKHEHPNSPVAGLVFCWGYADGIKDAEGLQAAKKAMAICLSAISESHK